MIFCDEIGAPRSNESFYNNSDIDFHNNESMLKQLNLNMITQIPLCALHLWDLGVTRKILNLYIKLYLTRGGKRELGKRLKTFKAYTPKDFDSKAKSLDELPHWKGHDFRRFLLYEGPAALLGLLPDNVYENFLKLSCAYRLLFMGGDTNIDEAEILLKNFVKEFTSIFGNNVTFNVHCLLHFSRFVRLYGQPDNFSTYKFENAYQVFKTIVRSPNRILIQES